MKKTWVVCLATALLALAVSGADASLVIYNDCGGTFDGEAANVNHVQLNTSATGLKDFGTGLATTVTVASANVAGQGISGGTNQTPAPTNDTEFGQIFNGIVNQVGAFYVGKTVPIVVTIGGLDPGASYEFVIAVNRHTVVSPAWNSLFTLSDVDSFTNTSSTGPGMSMATSVMTNDMTYCPVDNGTTGYVVRYTSIKAGADGDFVFSMIADNSGGTATANGYMNAWRLSEVPEPASMTLLALGGIALLRRRK